MLQRVSGAQPRLPLRRVQRHLAVTTRIILEKPASRKRWRPGVKSYQTLTLFIPCSNQTGLYWKQCGLWVGERVSLPHYYLFPEGALEPGGSYLWSVHARDVNEHILLGDFHNGSISEKFHFSVADSPFNNLSK